MSLCEPLGAIERVNPDDHIVFVELIRELLGMPFCVCCRNTINELQFSQVAPVAALLLLDVVIQKQVSAHVVYIELIRLNVGRFCGNLVYHFVLFTDDCGSGVQLF